MRERRRGGRGGRRRGYVGRMLLRGREEVRRSGGVSVSMGRRRGRGYASEEMWGRGRTRARDA